MTIFIGSICTDSICFYFTFKTLNCWPISEIYFSYQVRDVHCTI